MIRVEKLPQSDLYKVSFVFYLGDAIMTNAEEGVIFGLPVRYEVKERN